MNSCGSTRRSIGIIVGILSLILVGVVTVTSAWQCGHGVDAVGGPWIPIPDTTDCSVQLSAEMSQAAFLPDEPVMVNATFHIRGPCTWKMRRTNPFRDFILIIDRINADGTTVHLANEETYWRNTSLGWAEVDRRSSPTVDAEHPYRQVISLHTWFDVALTEASMYDIFRPGTYAVKLVRLLPGGGRVPSNELTFTRLP